MRIVSWNVNGIAACRRKGFLKFLADVKPDILCCQEVKTRCTLHTPGYLQYWNNAKRAGYSGTLVLTRREPLSFSYGMGIEEFDTEGRLITLEYKDYFLVNVYAPSLNPHSAPDRPDFRSAWDTALREYVSKLSKPVIMAGDFNVARAFIDSYPENQKNVPDDPVFQPETRENFEQLLAAGFVDVFRTLYPQKEGAYTWWGPKNCNRTDNRGSRLDYFVISGELLSCVQSVKFYVDTVASDHCPIAMTLNPITPKYAIGDEYFAALWRIADIEKAEKELFQMQQKIALAAFYQDWKNVRILQDKLVCSWPARVMAVNAVSETNSQAGVDGVRWKTDVEKGRAAMSLTPRDYRPLPYRHTEVVENGKTLSMLVPAARDKAMLILYAYALDPVAESTADPRSFFSRKGRSLQDVHAYLSRDLSGPNAPDWAAIIDIRCFYNSIAHNWLLENIPMDRAILRKFLKAGAIINGELFPTNQGLSYASSLSPILANMMLDGMQSYIYERLYPTGNNPYRDASIIRFADDVIVTARSKEQAELIMQIIIEFLEERGLKINQDKSHIVDIRQGFDFLSRHYQRKDGILHTKPASSSIKKMERELEGLIMNFRGTQRTLIKKINDKLSGWGAYHRVEDAYMEFRHIDAVVEALLIRYMCEKYSHWHKQSVLNRFWVKDGLHFVFALPNEPTVRVHRLAPTNIVAHKPCKLKYNPYLDTDYIKHLQHRRNIQKANGKYRGIWNRQAGRCAYCGQAMLPDQEVDVVEIILGRGNHPNNLQYIHRRCADRIILDAAGADREPLDIFAMLDGFAESELPLKKSPYYELTEYFRLSSKSPISLTFKQIEGILGEPLPWEAGLYEAFWFDPEPGVTSPMWQEEHFPIHAVTPSNRDYCICASWQTQGYEIKQLHLPEQYVVFRRTENFTSGLRIPRALTERRLPDRVIYECEQFFREIIRKYGL